MPPWKLGVTRSQAVLKSRRCLRTSSHGRFVLAVPDFRSVSFLPLEHGHRCPSLLRTSASVVSVRFGKGCSESETNDTRRLFGARVVPLRMELRGRGQPYAHREVSRDRRRERFVRGSAEKPRLSLSIPCSRVSPGSRIKECQTGPAQ